MNFIHYIKNILDNNELGPEGAKWLSEALKINKTLTNLNLGKNNVVLYYNKETH